MCDFASQQDPCYQDCGSLRQNGCAETDSIRTVFTDITVNPLIEAGSQIQAESLLEAVVNENIEYDSILGYQYSSSFALVLIYVHAICIGLSIQ